MNEKEIHLRDYLLIIRKRKYIVITFFLITFIVALIGSLSSAPVYKASVKLLIEKSKADPLVAGYRYLSYDPEFLQTQFQIISSTSVAKKVVKLLDLENSYSSFFQKEEGKQSILSKAVSWLKDIYALVLKLGGLTKSHTADQEKTDNVNAEISKADILARIIKGGITVEPVVGTRIVSVSFRSQNPVLAKMIVNTVAKAYIEEILEMRMEASGYTIKWMAQKADEERQKLEQSETLLQNYMREKDIITVENKITILPQKLSEISSRLTKAQARRKELETLFSKVKEVSIEDAETIPVISANEALVSIRQEVLKVEQAIDEFSKKYGQKHPIMKRTVGELDLLSVKREQEIRRVVKSIGNDLELARSNEDNLIIMLEKTKHDAVNLNEKFIQYGMLKREVDTNRLLYDALIRKIKEQSITQQVQTVDVKVVEMADTPKYPTNTSKKRNILLGMILGLFGGIALVIFVEYLDNTIKSPDDAEERLRVPVLGSVSLLTGENQKLETIVMDDPLTPIAENFKTLRTSIMLSSADSHPRSLLVTSMLPEDGKTTNATNIAIAISMSEKNVLLIDGDMRRPGIHKIFGLGNSIGLSTFLSGESDINILQKGLIPNLNILTSGPISPNPSELLSSDKMIELMESVYKKFDVVVVDSSPIMAVTDSLILSKVVDGTILVVKSGKTTYDVTRRGLKSLNDIGANILGLIVNGLDIKRSGYNYYSYSEYYQSSDDEEG